MAKLVAIGDSMTQGFQSGAILKTHLSYPAMIARALGAPWSEQDYPTFGDESVGGLPLNLELLIRELQEACGPRLDPLVLPRAVWAALQFVDRCEDYWERGAGSGASGTGPLHRNLAVWGFMVGDADLISEAVCSHFIGRVHKDDLGPPDWPIYRTARRVLNPRFEDAHVPVAELTPNSPRLRAQVDVAAEIARLSGGIENLIFYLGANNCLWTTVEMDIRHSEREDVSRFGHQVAATLWFPEHFAQVYERVARRVSRIGAERVFVGTVPHVTIAPVTRGVNVSTPDDGPIVEGPDGKGGSRWYYEYYTRFWVWDEDFRADPDRYTHLTAADAMHIDGTVDRYNEVIRRIAEQYGWHVVDICGVLDGLAFRRRRGDVGYELPTGLLQAIAADPTLSDRLRTTPDKPYPVDTRFLRLAEGRRICKGGLIGLDGIHPTTIGYGIMAHEFLKVMSEAGTHDPASSPGLDWRSILDQDTLLMDPPLLLNDLQNLLGFLNSLRLVQWLLKAMSAR